MSPVAHSHVPVSFCPLLCAVVGSLNAFCSMTSQTISTQKCNHCSQLVVACVLTPSIPYPSSVNYSVPRQMSTFALTVYRHTCPSPTKPDGPPLNIDFWDTAGQERFNSMHPSYYYRAHACLLVFDAQRKLTYTHLDHWYDELQRQRPGLPVIVAANKVDAAEDAVNKAFAFTKKRGGCVGGVRFVSAADGRNVVRVMKELIGVADEYRRRGNEADFTGEVMDVLDYFDRKEKAAGATGKAVEEEKTG